MVQEYETGQICMEYGWEMYGEMNRLKKWINE